MIAFPTWKKALVAFICLIGIAYAMPNVSPERFSALPGWAPNQGVSLGLDLQGGAHLLIEVETQAVFDQYLESIVGAVRAELRSERIRYRGLGLGPDGNSVQVSITQAADLERALQLLREIDPEIELSVDGNRVVFELTDQQITERRLSAVQQSIEIIRRRIDETGVREPTIQRQGQDRIIVQLPGVDDTRRIKALIGQTARMTFHLVDIQNSVQDAMAGRVPPGSMLLPMVDQTLNAEGRQILVRREVAVSGENLVDAQPGFDGRTNRPVVTFRFDTRGARQFGDITTENVDRPFAIVLDGEVISAPTIQEPILGGAGQISGTFSVQETADLALVLRAGALPAPITYLEERSVGPGLGADSIAAGQTASIIGLIGVLIFMFICYGRFGLYADIALVMNIVLIFAALSALQATLTLPGIAGIVLTIGMAVDANVLIFERIKEEARVGRTPISAVDAGYGRALTTIIDANITTLIAAILLYAFGSGPIRGFAVTLAIGIVTSMFTAIMLTRLFVVVWLRSKKPDALPV